MKQCPKCLRRYSDNSLNFCLEDGSTLATEAYDSAKATGPDPEATLISPVSPAPPPTPLRASVHPSSIQSSDSPSRWVLVAGLVLLAVLLGGGAVAFLYRLNRWDSPANGSKPTNLLATPAPKPSRPTPQPTDRRQETGDSTQPSGIQDYRFQISEKTSARTSLQRGSLMTRPVTFWPGARSSGCASSSQSTPPG